ncbi:MAG: DUF4783 domain-containing protein [Bacteroidota bacterium]
MKLWHSIGLWRHTITGVRGLPLLFLLITALQIILPAKAQAQEETLEKVKQAMIAGNTVILESLFTADAEISVPGSAGHTDKKAPQQMREFFRQKPPMDFKYLHKGSTKGDRSYATGRYACKLTAPAPPEDSAERSKGGPQGTTQVPENKQFKVFVVLRLVSGTYKVESLEFSNE